MARDAELSAATGAEWWRAELPLPELLFRVDFVTMDANSGAVDNNGCAACVCGCMEGSAGRGARAAGAGPAPWHPTHALSRAPPAFPSPPLLCFPRSGKDFQLTLTGAISQQELQRKRIQLLEAYELQRMRVRGRCVFFAVVCVVWVVCCTCGCVCAVCLCVGGC